MESIRVSRVKKIRAELQVPGDKSISHRSVILAGLAVGETRIKGFLKSEDCMDTLRAMQSLGVETETIDDDTFVVHGKAGKFEAPSEPIDCGNSGTGMRLLAGILATQPFESRLIGDTSLSGRPMKRVVDPLVQMGAEITCEGENQRPPLVIKGGNLKGIDYTTPVPSAQVKSCVLLAGLLADGATKVTETALSRDHTERMLDHFNAGFQKEGNTSTVYGGQSLVGDEVLVPGDFSSASFWLVAAAAMPGSRLKLPNVGMNPTRCGLVKVLLRMGAKLRENIGEAGKEPVGMLEIMDGVQLQGTEIGGDEIPNVIDEIPIIAVAAALAKGKTVIKDAKELRVKESDRLASVARNLTAFGVPVEEQPDGLIIHGGARLKGATVDSYGDHRIAMSSLILGLFASGSTTVKNTACIRTSYPNFEEHLKIAMDGQGGFLGLFGGGPKKMVTA